MPNGAGGGGGGGTIVGVSNSFTGPATALEILGDHVYCYSGEFILSTDEQTLMEFRSPSGYIVAELVTSGGVNQGNGAGGTTTWQLTFNGAVVMDLKIETYADRAAAFGSVPIIIPAYTEVKLTADSASTDAGFLITSSIIGRIYRG